MYFKVENNQYKIGAPLAFSNFSSLASLAPRNWGWVRFAHVGEAVRGEPALPLRRHRIAPADRIEVG